MENTQTELANHEILDALNRRYATKKFDGEKKLSTEQRNTLLESLRLSASSMGLQPYRFFHITDPKMRQTLREHSNGQSQITEASDMIVFAAMRTVTEAHVKEYVQMEGEIRERSEEQIKRKIKSTMGYVSGMSDEEQFQWSARQTYIALGNLLTVAAALNIDACPMEGINTDKYDRILQLKNVNLRCLAVVTLGYRSNEDAYANQRKVRFPRGKLIKTL